MSNIHITNRTKGKRPRLPFVSIKKAVLGKDYILSLVFVGDKESHRLNKTYRDKDKPTNVLAFPIGENEGEIFINTRQAEREAKDFNRTTKNFIAFLFIHALMHLKGFDHGSRMESKEKEIRRMFGI